jgi:hypothetical protein
MKKLSDSKTIVDEVFQDIKNMSSETFEENLKKSQETFSRSFEYKIHNKRKQLMEEFKRQHPLSSLMKNNPCDKCLIVSICNKCFYDGSACEKYKRAITNVVKEWRKNKIKKYEV